MPLDRDLLVRVMKAGRDLRLPAANDDGPGRTHLDGAAAWKVPGEIRIHAVSIPEQSEVALYTDIEVSTATEMYMEQGHIFRMKYAGPSLRRNPPSPVSFSGSNITTTNIVFPAGLSIPIRAGEVIQVHLDVINHSPYEIFPMTQDVYLYYSVVPAC